MSLVLLPLSKDGLVTLFVFKEMTWTHSFSHEHFPVFVIKLQNWNRTIVHQCVSLCCRETQIY